MKLALTMDDIPMHAELCGTASWLSVHQSFVRAFKRHALPPVTGFVIGNRIAGDDQGAAVQAWMVGGNTVANHTYSHSRPGAMGAAAYLQDVVRNQALICRLNQLAPRRDGVDYFRYPYLDAGNDEGTRHDVAMGLGRAGLVVAPVTLSLADWYWNEAYLSCPEPRREALFVPLAKMFLGWTQKTLRYYQGRAKGQGSAAKDHIICWHVGVFQSRVIAPFLAQAQADRMEFVSLDQAMQSHGIGTDGDGSHVLRHNLYGLRLPAVMAASHAPPPLPKEAIAQLLAGFAC